MNACCKVCSCPVAAAIGCLGVNCRLLDVIGADCWSMMGAYFSASRMSVRDLRVLAAYPTSVASLRLSGGLAKPGSSSSRSTRQGRMPIHTRRIQCLIARVSAAYTNDSRSASVASPLWLDVPAKPVSYLSFCHLGAWSSRSADRLSIGARCYA